MPENAERPLRVGVIGAGLWASQAHLPALRGAGAEVRALCTRDAVRAEELAERLDVPHAHGDWRELLARGDLDAVVVATPPAAHLEQVEAALELRLPVLCEMPLAVAAADARRLAERAAELGVVTGTSRPRPFNFNGAELVERLRAGALGPLRRAHFELAGHPWLRAGLDQTWRVRADAGPPPLVGMALGLAVELLGPIAAIEGRLRVSDGNSERAADELAAVLVSEAGAQATLQAGWSPTPRMQVALYGERGAYLWDLAAGGAVLEAREGTWQPLLESAPERFTAPAEFVAAVRSGRQHPLDFARAAHELELAEQLRHSGKATAC